MAELLNHGSEIVEVARETNNYQLTMLEWAKRFDEVKGEIIASWGEETYRVFRVFLWVVLILSGLILCRRITLLLRR